MAWTLIFCPNSLPVRTTWSRTPSCAGLPHTTSRLVKSRKTKDKSSPLPSTTPPPRISFPPSLRGRDGERSCIPSSSLTRHGVTATAARYSSYPTARRMWLGCCLPSWTTSHRTDGLCSSSRPCSTSRRLSRNYPWYSVHPSFVHCLGLSM